MKLLSWVAVIALSGCASRVDDPANHPMDPAPVPKPADSGDDTRITQDTAGTEDTGKPPLEVFGWLSADSGSGLSCGLGSDGSMRCWGESYCEVVVPGGAEPFTQVSVGLWEACGLRLDGSLSCWCCGLAGEPGEQICSEAPSGAFTAVRVGHDSA